MPKIDYRKIRILRSKDKKLSIKIDEYENRPWRFGMLILLLWN